MKQPPHEAEARLTAVRRLLESESDEDIRDLADTLLDDLARAIDEVERRAGRTLPEMALRQTGYKPGLILDVTVQGKPLREWLPASMADAVTAMDRDAASPHWTDPSKSPPGFTADSSLCCADLTLPSKIEIAQSQRARALLKLQARPSGSTLVKALVAEAQLGVLTARYKPEARAEAMTRERCLDVIIGILGIVYGPHRRKLH